MLSITKTQPFVPCPDPFNMADYVLGLGQRTPDKIALAVLGPTGSDRWSYARLTDAVLGTGTGLINAGAAPGDRVLLRLSNSVEFPIAYLGAIAAGLIPVPISSQLTGVEVAAIITEVSPVLILRADGLDCPECDIPVVDEAALKAMSDLPPIDPHMGDPNRPAYMIYTSGTSGKPRAVVHAHRAIWARQMMHKDWYDLHPTDRLLHAGAFNWSYTMGTGLMDPWTIGATALIPDESVSIAQLPLIMKHHEATIFAAVPGVYRKILDAHPSLFLPRLRHGLSAGEKLPAAVHAAWRSSTGTEIYEAFGMSECSTFISACPARRASDSALGWPQRGRQVCILGPNGPVPRDEVGTIAVHRDDPGLMLGYFNAPEDSAARMQGDWFVTGDQGVMNAQGQISYVGRADDMMNAGGYRVSPLEVEAVLATLPGLSQSAVTDIEVKPGVRLIMAFYTGPAPLDEATLTAAIEPQLAPYKRPRRFIHVDHLPTNPNGKVQRRALQGIYEVLNGQT